MADLARLGIKGLPRMDEDRYRFQESEALSEKLGALSSNFEQEKRRLEDDYLQRFQAATTAEERQAVMLDLRQTLHRFVGEHQKKLDLFASHATAFYRWGAVVPASDWEKTVIAKLGATDGLFDPAGGGFFWRSTREERRPVLEALEALWERDQLQS